MRPVMISRMISKSFDVSASGRGFFALDDGFESDNMSLKKPLVAKVPLSIRRAGKQLMATYLLAFRK